MIYFHFRLLEDFEIALPVSPCKYLLTSNLAYSRPAVLVNTDTMSRRRYIMPYAPVGFWRRLIIHLWLYRKEMARVPQGNGQRPLNIEVKQAVYDLEMLTPGLEVEKKYGLPV
jgi:hypothetical protein